jgi:ATP-dependent DNA helicase RecG
MKFMERRGSGLTKIISETEKLPGYDSSMKPEFYSTPSDFRVVLKKVNYFSVTATAQVSAHDNALVTAHDERMNILVNFCSIPRSREEMQAQIGIEHREYFRKTFLKPLLKAGRLQMTIPDKPNSRNQKYIAV